MRLFLTLLVVVFAQNSFALGKGSSLSEKEKIEALIKTVEELKDAKFYRNGSAHTAKEAAKHLRMKWDYAGSKIKTAEDFIDKIATESSITGLDYKIVFANGKEMTSSEFLYAQLKKLNSKQ